MDKYLHRIVENQILSDLQQFPIITDFHVHDLP